MKKQVCTLGMAGLLSLAVAAGAWAAGAEVKLDAGVLAEGDATVLTVSEDGMSVSAQVDPEVYEGTVAYYVSAEDHEKVYVEADAEGAYVVPEAEQTSNGIFYVEPVRKSVTLSLAAFEEKGRWAGSVCYFLDVEGAEFDENGRLVGYESAVKSEDATREAANGDVIFFARDVMPGYQPKNNIAPHQMVKFQSIDPDGNEITVHGFFDYDFYAYDDDIDVASEQLIALEPTGEYSESYNAAYDSSLYTTNAEECSYPQSVDLALYYIRIGTDVTCWEEREPVKISFMDTLRDMTLGFSCSEADVEIALDEETLGEDTLVTVIDTDNNNRDNMGHIEYKGYSTEDTYPGLTGRMLTNWAQGTYVGNRNGGAAFTPGSWTANESGAAQYRCGEGVQLTVSDPESYEGIRVTYVGDDGEPVEVEVTDEPYPMYETDGQTQVEPEKAEGCWYFRCPMVTLTNADHLALKVEFIRK